MLMAVVCLASIGILASSVTAYSWKVVTPKRSVCSPLGKGRSCSRVCHRDGTLKAVGE